MYSFELTAAKTGLTVVDLTAVVCFALGITCEAVKVISRYAGGIDALQLVS